MLDIHEVMDIKQFIFTASLLVHLFLGCLKHLNTNKMCVAKIMSKQQVTLQIMECEPFLPLSRVNWVTTLSRDTSAAGAWVCTEVQPPIDTHGPTCNIHENRVLLQLQTLKYPYELHLWLEPILPFIPHQDKPIWRQFSLLTHGSSLTLAPVKPQCTKSTMPNIYNLYKNSTSPYWPP